MPVDRQLSFLVQVLQVVLAGSVLVPRAAALVQALPLRPNGLASNVQLLRSRAAARGVSLDNPRFSALEAIAFVRNSPRANVSTGLTVPMAMFTLATL